MSALFGRPPVLVKGSPGQRESWSKARGPGAAGAKFKLRIGCNGNGKRKGTRAKFRYMIFDLGRLLDQTASAARVGVLEPRLIRRGPSLFWCRPPIRNLKRHLPVDIGKISQGGPQFGWCLGGVSNGQISRVSHSFLARGGWSVRQGIWALVGHACRRLGGRELSLVVGPLFAIGGGDRHGKVPPWRPQSGARCKPIGGTAGLRDPASQGSRRHA